MRAEEPSLANYTPPERDDAGNVVAGSPEDVLHRYRVTVTNAPGLSGFYCYAYDDGHAKASAEMMIKTYRNDGRGPYKDMKLSGVKRDDLRETT